jgi:hypothetical protein
VQQSDTRRRSWPVSNKFIEIFSILVVDVLNFGILNKLVEAKKRNLFDNLRLNLSVELKLQLSVGF